MVSELSKKTKKDLVEARKKPLSDYVDHEDIKLEYNCQCRRL